MALSADRNTAHQDGESLQQGVAANAKVYGGGMIAKNADGYMQAAADAANLVVAGVSEEQVDNTDGANGALNAKFRRGRAFWLKNSGTNAVTVAHLYGNVYVEDDETVSSSGGTNNIVAGKCLDVDSGKGVLVYIG